MEAVEVLARFDPQGNIIPVNFTWNARTYPIESTGRKWRDQHGRHILVMVPGERVFELLFNPQEERWFLKKIGEQRTIV
jgi:hypothetical protein